MSGVVVGEVDALLISEDGSALPVVPDADAPSSPRGLLAAGVEIGDAVDIVRLFHLDANGRIVVAEAAAILRALNGISEQLSEITGLLSSLAED